MLRFQNDTPDFGFTTTGAAAWQWCMSKEGIVDDKTWVHVAGTLDGKTMRIYVDGELANEVNQSGKVFSGEAAFQLARHGSDSGFFAGALDEVALFNRALNPSEIKQAMDGLEEFILAVEPQGKLTTTWGKIKNQ